MKHHLYTVLVGLSLLISGAFACSDLEVLAPCSQVTAIIFDDCNLPCERTFRLANVENLDNARFSWTLSGESIVTENFNTSEFTYAFDSGGDYDVVVNVSFDFSGCDQTLDESFNINGELPDASIGASRMECIVGDCTIKLWQENLSRTATSWTWSIPNDSNEYADEDTVMVALNDAPNEYLIGLTATNINGTVTTEKTITVKPHTFVLLGDQEGMEDLDNILCLRENSDGSFSAIGNNEASTHSFKVSRAGIYDVNSFDAHNVPRGYDQPIGRNCKIINGSPIVIGDVSFSSTNSDFYLASFGQDFSLGLDKTFRVGTNGTEFGSGITAGLDGGFIVCGSTRRESGSNSGVQGMAFVRLSESFILQGEDYHFTGNPDNVALDIITLSDEYLVTGIVEGRSCYFRLNASLDLVAGSLTFLGEDFKSPFLVKTDSENFLLIGRAGSNTIIHAVENLTQQLPEQTINLTNIKGAKFVNGQLALVGYRGTFSSRQPVLLVFNGIDFSNIPSIEETFLTTEEAGEFFNVALTDDGGFLLGGSIGRGSNIRTLMVRTNSTGKL
ncbi:hypothetical protein [Neolewinella persica]|uniref:hypothetical protein n=1 Tax=Neolewinella persica TaxID=70998 RepID=UPI0003A992BC|nr:hypothetical protein [Neolewinella persica]